MEPGELGLDYAIESFKTVLGLGKVHPFGMISRQERGVSDGNEGVQWHIGVNKDEGTLWFGPNLEGKKYGYWPIAVFIENELENSKLLYKLLDIARSEDGTKIWIGFNRDAWQVRARPRTEEERIGGCMVRLSDLTDIKWKQMLEEAYACLDPKRNHRGRARQTVTLIGGEKREMEVSPHLLIEVRTYIPTTAKQTDTFVREVFKLLSPLYEIVKEQSLR